MHQFFLILVNSNENVQISNDLLNLTIGENFPNEFTLNFTKFDQTILVNFHRLPEDLDEFSQIDIFYTDETNSPVKFEQETRVFNL